MEAAHKQRLPLTRERVLRAAAELADERGLEALTMRTLGHELGVEAMSLYNHVKNKDDLLDGVIEVVGAELLEAVERVPPPPTPAECKEAIRGRILAARDVLLRHRWAPAVLETRVNAPPSVMQHYDALLGLMLGAGFSSDLAHHAMHALGSRALGFSQELFVCGRDDQFEFEFALDLLLDGLDRMREAPQPSREDDLRCFAPPLPPTAPT